MWERLRRRDTSKATLSFGSRSTGQQIGVLDAADEEFGEASAGVATVNGAAARPCRGECSEDEVEVVRCGGCVNRPRRAKINALALGSRRRLPSTSAPPSHTLCSWTEKQEKLGKCRAT